MKAYLGAAAIFALVLVPLLTVLIIGARSGRRRKGKGNWTDTLSASPAEFLDLIYKIRPK